MKTAERWQRLFAVATVAVLAMQFSITRIVHAQVAPLQMVINEIAWAGSADSSSDEWIELYNNSDNDIDLSGWYIEDDYTSSYLLSGVIKAHGYFLIEDDENTVSNRSADLIVPLSLANTGDSLVLKTGLGDIIDSVNAEGGAWYAGDSVKKSTMERIDPVVNGNDSGNWASSIGSGSYKSSLGSQIIGTPGEINSVFDGIAPLVTVVAGDVDAGAEMTVSINMDEVSDLYSYGFDVIYDPKVLEYMSATESDLLGNDSVDTGFFSALENNVPGKVVVGSARLGTESGIDASGKLFSLKFKAIGTEEQQSFMNIGSGFLADSKGDIIFKTKNAVFTLKGKTVLPPVSNFKGEIGERYKFAFSWDDMAVEKYQVVKKMPNTTWKVVAEVTGNVFVDSGTEVGAGVEYEYGVQVLGDESTRSVVKIQELRGLKGDLDKSDRVDGRDLDALARSFASVYGEASFKLLNDLNYDGFIDGSDLIDLGISFGLVYSE